MGCEEGNLDVTHKRGARGCRCRCAFKKSDGSLRARPPVSVCVCVLSDQMMFSIAGGSLGLIILQGASEAREVSLLNVTSPGLPVTGMT